MRSKKWKYMGWLLIVSGIAMAILGNVLPFAANVRYENRIALTIWFNAILQIGWIGAFVGWILLRFGRYGKGLVPEPKTPN
jgi:threonine/homoserine efflux transporter RhtA